MRYEVIKKAYEYAVNGNIVDITFVKLADDLNVSRRSLYRVFENKNELLFEVYKLIISDLLEHAHCLNYKGNDCEYSLSNEEVQCLANRDLNSGYFLVENGVKNMISVFLNNPNKLKYITTYDSIPNKSTHLLKLQNEFYRKCDFTYNFIIIGQKDGSIKSKEDPYKLSCIILETVLGFMSRYIDLSNNEFSSYLQSKDFCLFISMIMNYLNS